MKVFVITLLAFLAIARASGQTPAQLDYSKFAAAQTRINNDIASLQSIVRKAGRTINGASSEAANQVAGVKTSLSSAFDELTSAVATTVGSIVTNVLTIVDSLIETLGQAISGGPGAVEFGQTQLELLENNVQSIVDYANAATDQNQVDAATTALNNIADAMDKQIKTLGYEVTQFVQSVENVATPVVKLLENVIDAILSGKLLRIVTSVPTAVVSLATAALKIPAALNATIKSGSTTIVSTLKDFVSTAKDAAATLTGIK